MGSIGRIDKETAMLNGLRTVALVAVLVVTAPIWLGLMVLGAWMMARDAQDRQEWDEGSAES